MARRRRAAQFEFVKGGGEFLKKNKLAVFGVLLFLAAVIAGIVWLNGLLQTSPYFDCSAVEIIKVGEDGRFEAKKEFFQLTPGVNIFSADHVMLSNRIKRSHPEFQDVEIIKYLPNRIIAKIRDRRPVAKIKVGRIYQVDFEGMVLSDKDTDSLPLVIGMESQLFNPTVGKPVKSRRLARALNILALISERAEFKDSVISVVDLSYPEKANFKMDGITVVLGDNEYERKLDLLARILKDPKIDRSRLESVDLRFTDVVMKTKPEKK
jgi:cell division septal protein FtsQ